MPRTTDLPSQILELLESSDRALRTNEVAAALPSKKVAERTVRTHLLDLYQRELVLREYVYDDRGVGAYAYRARPGMTRAKR